MNAPTITIEAHDDCLVIMHKAQHALLEVNKKVAKAFWKVAKVMANNHGYLGVLDITAKWVNVATVCPNTGKVYLHKTKAWENQA